LENINLSTIYPRFEEMQTKGEILHILQRKKAGD